MRAGRLVYGLKGSLVAYDAGVDSSSVLTDPSDASPDKPTIPPKNIAPLREDETDPFGRRIVGSYAVRRVD